MLNSIVPTVDHINMPITTDSQNSGIIETRLLPLVSQSGQEHYHYFPLSQNSFPLQKRKAIKKNQE